MGKVAWDAETDRKLLIFLIDKSAKSYNSEALAKLFEGATPKAIEERIAKLKREAKSLDPRCAVPLGSPHKPKGNYFTKPPVPGKPNGGYTEPGPRKGGGKGKKRFRFSGEQDDEMNKRIKPEGGAPAEVGIDQARHKTEIPDDMKPPLGFFPFANPGSFKPPPRSASVPYESDDAKPLLLGARHRRPPQSIDPGRPVSYGYASASTRVPPGIPVPNSSPSQGAVGGGWMTINAQAPPLSSRGGIQRSSLSFPGDYDTFLLVPPQRPTSYGVVRPLNTPNMPAIGRFAVPLPVTQPLESRTVLLKADCSPPTAITPSTWNPMDWGLSSSYPIGSPRPSGITGPARKYPSPIASPPYIKPKQGASGNGHSVASTKDHRKLTPPLGSPPGSGVFQLDPTIAPINQVGDPKTPPRPIPMGIHQIPQHSPNISRETPRRPRVVRCYPRPRNSGSTTEQGVMEQPVYPRTTPTTNITRDIGRGGPLSSVILTRASSPIPAGGLKLHRAFPGCCSTPVSLMGHPL
ncbi:hypothetical protein ABW19_dt0203378 [Dactylella cylindrospora]|nr:hypothetical protein ABW19_dt0203378 [Dactylella cylindrospora]